MKKRSYKERSSKDNSQDVNPKKGPFTIARVHKNWTLTITYKESGVATTLHMRRMIPFYE